MYLVLIKLIGDSNVYNLGELRILKYSVDYYCYS